MEKEKENGNGIRSRESGSGVSLGLFCVRNIPLESIPVEAFVSSLRPFVCKLRG